MSGCSHVVLPERRWEHEYKRFTGQKFREIKPDEQGSGFSHSKRKWQESWEQIESKRFLPTCATNCWQAFLQITNLSEVSKKPGPPRWFHDPGFSHHQLVAQSVGIWALGQSSGLGWAFPLGVRILIQNPYQDCLASGGMTRPTPEFIGFWSLRNDKYRAKFGMICYNWIRSASITDCPLVVSARCQGPVARESRAVGTKGTDSVRVVHHHELTWRACYSSWDGWLWHPVVVLTMANPLYMAVRARQAV